MKLGVHLAPELFLSKILILGLILLLKIFTIYILKDLN